MEIFPVRDKILAITLLIAPLTTFAAGFQINEISPGLQGDALAGAAAANNDVSALFINPATLASLQKNQLYLGANEILPSIEMSDAHAIHTVNIPGSPPSDITATVLGKTSQGNISQGAFVPDGYIGIRLTPTIVAGLSVTGPFGLKTHYDNDSVIRFAADYSSIRAINLTPAIAISVHPKLDLGIGFQAQYLKAEISNYNGPYTGIPAIDAFIASTQPTLLHAHGWGYGYTAGLLYRPDACTRLGAGFRSQISEQLRGNGRQILMPGDTVPAPTQNFPFNAQTSVDGAIKTPAVLLISAARDIYQWTVKATAQYIFWNTFNQLSINMPDAFATNSTIQTHWRNTWFGSLGAEYRATPCWTFRGGVAYDQTPTVDTFRDPRIPDNDRYWANIGATWKLNDCFSIDAVYSHLFIRKSTVDVTQASGTNALTTVPLEVNQVSANYDGSADIVGVAARFSF